MIVNKIRELRLQRSLTVLQVAEQTGVSPVTVGRLDRNPRYHPRMQIMERLAFGLRVRLSELFEMVPDDAGRA